MNFLSGYKTYIIAALVGAVTVAHTLGYINDEIFKEALGFLGAGGLVTLRAAVK